MRRLALSFLAASALFVAQAQAQTNFGTYVSIGDSLAAGFWSGGLAENHQQASVPALLARQAGAQGFELPLVGAPGIPPVLKLVDLTPTIVPSSATPGAPRNLTLPRPYNNLAVPGATSVDALTRVTDGGGLHDLILRGLGTQVQQAAALKPTVVTVWIGNNDVLGAAIRGTAIEGVTLTPTAVFKATYAAIIAQVKATGAFVVAANLPDVTSIPYVTTIAPYVVNPSTRQPVLNNGATIPLLGPQGPLPADAFVTLAASSLLAQGIGIPAALGGRGTPLPDEVVLYPSEIATIKSFVDTNNASIREICGAAGVPVLDVNALLNEIAHGGRNVGGITITSSFLTGGAFSYDGVHPTDAGYALLANEWIRVIDENGGKLPYVDLSPVLGVHSASARPVVPEFSWEAYQQLLDVFPTVDRK